MDNSDLTSNLTGNPPDLPGPELHLEVLFGPDRGRKIPLVKNPTLIGRTQDCDVVLEDLLVSRRHVTLLFNGSRATLRDLGSLNGIRVAGAAIQEAPLAPDQTFEIGTTALVLRRGRAEQEVRQPPLLQASETQPLNPIPTGAGPQPMVRKRSSDRHAPATWLVRMVSWSVILLICGGGMILALTLLESTGGGGVAEPRVAEPQAPVQEVERKARRLRTKPIPQEPGAFLAEAPKTTDQRDVALELYEQAMAAGKKDDLKEAVALLEQVTARYPEFTPVSGEPIGETIDRYKRTQHVGGIVRQAKAALDAPDATPAALQSLLAELETIPATEGEFGGEAVLLADRVRSRIRQISFGIAPSTSLPPEAVKRPAQEPTAPGSHTPAQETRTGRASSQEAPAPADTLKTGTQAPAEAGSPAEKTSPIPGDDTSTWAPVRKAYQKGDFATAQELALQLAQLGPLALRPKAEALTIRLKEFEGAYKAAMTAGQKEGKELQALGLLAVAKGLDLALFGVFQAALERQEAEVYLRQARGALKEKKFERVRDLMGLAQRLGPGLEAAREFQVLVTTQATELLQKGKKAPSLAEAGLAYRQAATLAGEQSPTGREALRLLQELSAASLTP